MNFAAFEIDYNIIILKYIQNFENIEKFEINYNTIFLFQLKRN